MKTRSVIVSRNYGETKINHVVTEHDGKAEIKIEMPLEPFVAAVLERIIANVGNPLTVMTRKSLAEKIRAGLNDAVNAEIQEMKNSTIYKTAQLPDERPELRA